jgi:outer membrane protein assembly factor BamA
MKYRSWIVILLVLLCAPPVHGQEDVWQYGRNFKGWEVKSLTITGLPGRQTSDVRKGLALDEDGAVLYEKILREDIDRIALFMARIGYPYTTVSLDVEPSRSGRKIHLTLDVNPGPAVRVTGVTVSGVPEDVPDRSIRVLPFADGDIFVESLQQQYNDAVLEALRESGYARAEVSASLVWSDTVTVAVEVEVIPGAVYYFRRVEASGASDNLMGLVYTMADIHPGDRYHPVLLSDARDYLSKLGLFRQIRLDITDVPPDSLDLNIVVSERQFRSVEVGAGYWSDEKFSGRLGWKHRNLFRRGRGVSFEIVATQFRQYVEGLTWWPAIFGAKRSMWTFRLGINNENELSYEKTAPGIGTSISYLFTRNTGGTLGYFIERASYKVKTTEQPLFTETDGLVSWFETRFTRDATNDRVTPERGSFSWLRIQWGREGGVSESDWILGELSGTVHIPLKKRMLIAINARAGSGRPLGNARVLLPDKRFYEGGSVSHRGFGRRKLGPKDENGLPLGGEVMTTGFVEYRFPFIWNFEGALFTDWGQVWQTADDVNVRNLEVAIGPGLRLATPVGPFRLDWGWRLTNHDTTVSRWALHFAIGYPM